ncbi:MAG: ferric reductase [Pseudomonadota bacterium]
MPRLRAILIWAALAAALVVPVAIAAASPLLAWRDPVYIAASFAGVVAMGLLLLQPLLIGGHLPGLFPRVSRRAHAWIGGGLVLAVVAHVGGLWITSPPDVVDALLFRSPTPFSAWGVIAMWAVFAAGLLALWRRRFRPQIWRRWHMSLAAVIALGTVVHALLIEGTMGMVSKFVLSAIVLTATAKVLYDVATRTRAFQRRARG